MATSRICSIPDCGKPEDKRGWCSMHYQRWRKHGDPLAGKARTSWGETERFLRDVVLTYEGDECLIWPYIKGRDGYGKIMRGKQQARVHRLVCEEVNGPPPTPAHVAAHSCGKGHLACVAKRHLSWKTIQENKDDELTHGTRKRGEQHYQAKLTENDVRVILALKGKRQGAVLAKRFGVSISLIGSIQRGKCWAWLDK